MKKYANKEIWQKPKVLMHKSILQRKPELINIEIEISRPCNHHCVFCYTHGEKRKDAIEDRYIPKNSFFPSKRLFSLIDEINQVGCKSISFTGGGEPLLHKDIFKAMDKICSYGIEIGLTTNFSKKLTDNQFVILDKLAWVRVSLNASNKELYNKIQNPTDKNDFDRVIGNIKRLRDMGNTTINLSFVVCEENKHDINAVYELAKELKVDSLSFRPDVGYERNNFIFDEKTLSELKKLDDKDIILDTGIGRLSDMKTIDDDTPCYVSNHILFINMDGDVFPCCIVVLNRDFLYYNIMDNSFVDFWYSDLHMNHYKELNMKFCPPCHYTRSNLLLRDIYKDKNPERYLDDEMENNFL